MTWVHHKEIQWHWTTYPCAYKGTRERCRRSHFSRHVSVCPINKWSMHVPATHFYTEPLKSRNRHVCLCSGINVGAAMVTACSLATGRVEHSVVLKSAGFVTYRWSRKSPSGNGGHVSAGKQSLAQNQRPSSRKSPSVHSCFTSASPYSPSLSPVSAGICFFYSAWFPQLLQLLHRYLGIAGIENNAPSYFGCLISFGCS